jgi:UDP:flavonoid glycosyltransferase YjiC (YdhE family)
MASAPLQYSKHNRLLLFDISLVKDELANIYFNVKCLFYDKVLLHIMSFSMLMIIIVVVIMFKNSDWGPKIDVVGFCFLDLASNYEPPEELMKWLAAGEKPIYIGFGSLVSIPCGPI